MAAFEPLAARLVQANPLREEIRKLPTGVGFQGGRSVYVCTAFHYGIEVWNFLVSQGHFTARFVAPQGLPNRPI